MAQINIAQLLKREMAKAPTLQHVSRGADVGYASVYRFYHEDADLRLHNVQRLVDYFGYRLVKQRAKRGRRKVSPFTDSVSAR